MRNVLLIAAIAPVMALPAAAQIVLRGPLTEFPCEIPMPQLSCGTFTRGEAYHWVMIHEPATPSPRKDPLLVLLGGPGQFASGGGFPQMLRGYRVMAGDRTIVFVDQRGTGRSTPLLCPEGRGAQRYMDFITVADIPGCVAHLQRRGAQLARFGTGDFVEDLEHLRTKLGAEQWNLHGGSYGTRVALHYMAKYPASIRSAILVGTAPPELKMPSSFGADADRALGMLVRECKSDTACARAYPRFREEADSIARRLERAAAPVDVTLDTFGRTDRVQFTRAAFGEAIRGALYGWPSARFLPLWIHSAYRGDYRGLAQSQFDRQRSTDSWTGLYLAVTCAEDAAGLDTAAIFREHRATILGEGRARQHLGACAHWPKREAQDYSSARITTPVLMLTGERDPVTPPRWSEIALKRMTRGRLVVVPAGAHGFGGLQPRSCIPRIEADFIRSANPRAVDVSCAATLRRPAFVLR
jgi:pimeloyl-ACP methyl ester carboxylesterase